MISYVPIMKWKYAEYTATKHLVAADRAVILPVCEMMPTKGSLTPAEQVAGALQAFIKTAIRLEFDTLPNGFGLDARYLLAGGAPIALTERLCRNMQSKALDALPVVEPERVLAEPSSLPALKSHPGTILRVPVRDTALVDTLQALADLRAALGKRGDLTVILDLAGLGDAPDAAYVALVRPMVEQIVATGNATRLVSAGGSFPFSLQQYKQGRHELDRREWGIWLQLRTALGGEDLIFGDYVVTHPKLMEFAAGARIPALAQIRYAKPGKWVLHRAAMVLGAAGFLQYKQLCALMLHDPDYQGPAYSYGDKLIEHHADAATTTGSPQTWRRDATNHHLVQTLRQLAATPPAVTGP